MLRYKGAAHFRQRIVLATLSGRAVRIDDIRSEEEQVGLRDYEACFLRLLEKVVNGCEIVINETGTAMRYRPGIIVGGGGHVHECGTSRAISYFIQPLLALAPFGKQPLSVTLRGVTNATGDVGVDVLRTVTLPMLRHFGLSEGLSLQVNKRGAPPPSALRVPFVYYDDTRPPSVFAISPEYADVALRTPLLVRGENYAPVPLTLACLYSEYGATKGGTRYAPHDQIDRDNVHRLEQAWVYRTGDFSNGGDGNRATTFEANPILADGTLYICTPYNRVVALVPETGAELWPNHDMVFWRTLKRFPEYHA